MLFFVIIVDQVYFGKKLLLIETFTDRKFRHFRVFFTFCAKIFCKMCWFEPSAKIYVCIIFWTICSSLCPQNDFQIFIIEKWKLPNLMVLLWNSVFIKIFNDLPSQINLKILMVSHGTPFISQGKLSVDIYRCTYI